jgi:hypothetical protein
VACPFFEPQDLLEDPIFTRLPLGEAYNGRCHAQPSATDLPFKICNHGYARGRCQHFPDSCAVDAYRYTQTSGGKIVWIEEADHAPLRFGSAEDIAQGDGPIHQQLQAFQRAVKEGKIR